MGGFREKFLERHPQVKDWFCITCGCMLYAISLNGFLADNQIAAGGLAGIATVLNWLFHMRLSVLLLLLNVPLVLLGVWIKGWGFIRKTVGGFIIYTAFVELTSYLPTATSNPLAAAVFGGALNGIGVALMTVADGSIGGTELIVRILCKCFPNVGVGKLFFLVDGSVVLFSIIMFQNVEVGLYAILALYLCSYFADKLLVGFERGNLCLIITAKEPQTVCKPLLQELNLSITGIRGIGMFTGKERHILLTAIHAREISRTKAMLAHIDPESFVVILPVSEILGGRYRTKSHP